MTKTDTIKIAGPEPAPVPGHVWVAEDFQESGPASCEANWQWVLYKKD